MRNASIPALPTAGLTAFAAAPEFVHREAAHLAALLATGWLPGIRLAGAPAPRLAGPGAAGSGPWLLAGA